MANNRMYLVHKPTGFSFYLGKRMGYGWYCPDRELNEFFDYVSENDKSGDQDDFAVGLEDTSGSIVNVEVIGWDDSTPENKFTRAHFKFNDVSGSERSAIEDLSNLKQEMKLKNFEIENLRSTVAMLSRNQKDPKPIIDVPL